MNSQSAPATQVLGHLELAVLNVLWEHGEKNVREVIDFISRPLAYTTVMTTLDRLYKKGLLERRKTDRAFFYSARFTQEELERKRASEFMAPFLNGPRPFRELFVSCLVDAAANHPNEALLDELERRIKLKRAELEEAQRKQD